MLNEFTNDLNRINEKISSLDKELKTVLRNVTGDMESQLSYKKRELETASDSRKQVLEGQIIDLERSIKYNTEETAQMYKGKREKLYHELFDRIMEYFNSKEIEFSNNISKSEENLGKLQEQIKTSLTENDFETINSVSRAACDISNEIADDKKSLENIERIVTDINTLIDSKSISFEDASIKSKNYIQLLESSLSNYALDNNENESKNNNEEFSEDNEEAKKLVEKLENEMTEEALREAINGVADLADEQLKEELKARIRTCENKIKENEAFDQNIKAAVEAVEEYKTTNDQKNLEQAKKILEDVEDCKEKETILDKIELFEFDSMLTNCEEKLNNFELLTPEEFNGLFSKYDSLNDQRKVNYEKRLNLIKGLKVSFLVEICEKKLENKEMLALKEVNELVNEYKNSSIDIRTETIRNRINEIISVYNSSYVYDYHKNVVADKDLEKYGIARKTVELFSTGINKFNNSKLHRENLKKSLEKAEAQETTTDKNENKKARLNNELSNSVFVNGVKLFVEKDRIASLSPKLYRAERKQLTKFGKAINSIRSFRLSRASSAVSRIMNRELGKFTKDDSVFENPEMVKNIILQYLETIAIGSDYNETLKSFKNFLTNASDEGIINEAESDAYIYNAKIICDYRSKHNDLPYDFKEKELEPIIAHYSDDQKELDYIKESK